VPPKPCAKLTQRSFDLADEPRARRKTEARDRWRPEPPELSFAFSPAATRRAGAELVDQGITDLAIAVFSEKLVGSSENHTRTMELPMPMKYRSGP